ncbi:hypothetical protein, partial [Xanthomonas campestris]|uniref:hypothetical protein n=1 Tax=Xanthomonas campestris TaxID=339 RepID=UPI001ED93C80
MPTARPLSATRSTILEREAKPPRCGAAKPIGFGYRMHRQRLGEPLQHLVRQPITATSARRTALRRGRF